LGRGLGEGQKLQLTKVHPSPSSYLTPGWTMTAYFHSWMMCANTWRLLLWKSAKRRESGPSASLSVYNDWAFSQNRAIAF